MLRHALVLVRDGLRRGNSTRRPSKARTVALDLCRLLRQRPSYDDEDLCVMTALDAADAASKGAGEDWQTVAEPAFQMATGSRLVDCCLRLDDVVLARAPPFSSEPPGLASASVSICTPRRPPPGRARLASLAASDAALASTAADVLSSRGLLADLANLARVATSVRLPPSLAWINAIRSGDSADSSIFPTGTNACVDAVAELLLSEEDAVPLQTKWEIDDVCTDDAFQRAVQSDDEDLRASYAGIALARFAGNLDRPPTNLSSEACRIAERVVPDTATALKCLQLALVVSNDVADVWIASLFASDYFNKKKPTLPVRDTLLFDILKHTDSPSLPDLAQAIREHPNLTDTTPPQRITPIAQDILDQAAALRVV